MFSRKQLTSLIIPLVIEVMLAAAIGLADTLMVSNVGEAVVSGVSLVDTINMLIYNLFSALATGGTVIASQYLGRNDRDNAKRAAHQVFFVCLVASIVLAAVCAVFHRPILRLVFGNIEQDVMDSAIVYFVICAIGYPALALYNAGAAAFRAARNSRVPMLISVGMNIINVGGNALFIFGFGWAAAGAAAATTLSRIIGAVVIFVILYNDRWELNYRGIFPLRPEGVMARNILRIAVPSGIENSMFQIGKVVVQSFIAGYGTMAIAAAAVANSLSSITVMPGAAIGTALLTVVGQCVGAGESKQAKSYTLKLTGVAILALCVLGSIVLLTMRPITQLYGLAEATSEYAIKIMTVGTISAMILWAPAFVTPNGLRAAGDVKFTMTVAIVSMWIFRVALGYYLGTVRGFGALGIWYGMAADWLFRLIAYGWRLINNRWMKFGAIR